MTALSMPPPTYFRGVTAPPGAVGTESDDTTSPPLGAAIADLLSRMRQGDRAAAAEFMTRYRSRIRRRIRGKLNAPMRRLFDSMDVLSTVTRRLDLYVEQGRVEASAPEELWALVFRMADNAVIDRARMFKHLKSVEGSDGDFALLMLDRLRGCNERRHSSVELEIDQVLRSLHDASDRRLMSLWLAGDSYDTIAQHMGITSAAVRQRWCRIKGTIRNLINGGVL